ncbi:MAG: hypothetical protein IJ620_04770, partial [Bacteroidales bacterium]|nr:hypothetical protein [Bacteroidales bacterium]
MNLKRPLLFLLIGLALATGVRAQAPQRVSYQAVVCHANNRPASNEEVTLRLSVLLHRSNGDSVVYSEMHTTTTNPNGVLAVYLGAGTPTTSQRLSDIEWSRGNYLLRSELDPEGTKDYSSTIANSIVSVPYALHANSAGHADTAHEALHLRGLHDTLRIAFDTLVSKKQMNAALNLKSNLHHTHPTEDIEGLSAILAGKASNADLAVLATSLAAKADTSVLDSLASDRELNSARTSLQGAIGGKADTNHRHAVADIDGLSSVLATQVTVHALDTLASIRHLDNVRTALQTAIDSKIDTDALDTLASDRELNNARNDLQNAINGKADTNHGHRIDDVSGLRTELNGKASTASLAGLASSLSLTVNANSLDTLASVRELNTARNDLQSAINGKADTNHGH